MQKINISLRILDGVNASVVDEYNQLQNWTASIVRGMNAELVLKLFSSTTQDSAMAQADLDYASWDFVMSDDWDTATDPQIRVSSGITVDEDGLIHIPLTDTNTEELIAALGTAESVTLGCELCGFSAGETPPAFVLQWDISVRNRRSDAGTGTPTAVPDGSYNAAQVDALLAAKANSADIIIYVEGTGIDITDGTVSIDTTGATTGQVLKKTELGVGWADENTGSSDALPAVTAEDNDKILTVVNGAWAKADAPNGVTTVSVQTALSIDPVDGVETKVLSERGTFVNLPTDTDTTYSAGVGIDITNETISIDVTGATTGQIISKSESGVAWVNAPVSATTANVQAALSINTGAGSETKVLSERGTFVDLPEGGSTGGLTSDDALMMILAFS